MNYMKKLLGGGGAGPPPLANQDPQDALGLTHLNKLYGELAEPSEPLTQAEQQLKLYNMLPLFCKVFHSCPAESMQASFEYVVPFARAVAKLLVSEIRRRASNQSTETTSLAIAHFLEVSPTPGEASRGWLLLTAINLLAGAGPRVIEALASQALPSTLVKCLYLFFDLPVINNNMQQQPDNKQQNEDLAQQRQEHQQRQQASDEDKDKPGSNQKRPEEDIERRESVQIKQAESADETLSTGQEELTSASTTGSEMNSNKRTGPAESALGATLSHRSCETTTVNTGSATGISEQERRILLQKIFAQLVMRLCSQPCSAEELAHKDDLALLFSAITTWCPEHNVTWRKSAGEVLMTVSRHGLSIMVVNYMHKRRCLTSCIDNMRKRMHEFSSGQVLEMFVCLFCLLKDSSEISHVLLDEFSSCSGYGLVAEFMLRCESELDKEIGNDQNNRSQDRGNTGTDVPQAGQKTFAASSGSANKTVKDNNSSNQQNRSHMETDVQTLSRGETEQVLSSLSVLLTSLVTCGSEPLKPVHPQSLFHMDGFVLPPALARGTCVRNLDAYKVIESCFWRARTDRLQSLLLDSMASIYKADPANYFILDTIYPLSALLDRMHNKPKRVQIGLLKLVEYVPENLRFVPCKELVAVSNVIKEPDCSEETALLCLETLQNVLKVKPSLYKNVFREVGLLEVLVLRLQLFRDEQELVQPIIDVLQALLSGSQENCSVFRDSGGLKYAQGLLRSSRCRPLALGLFKEVMTSSASPDEDMTWLLAAVPTADAQVELKIDCLLALHGLLAESHRIRSVFRKVNGFVYLMTLLACLEGCLSPAQAPLRPPQLLRLIRTILDTIAVAMRYEPANAKVFANEICATNSLVDSLKLLGCFACGEDGKEKSLEQIHAVFTGDAKDDVERYDHLDVCTLIMRFLYDMAVDCNTTATKLLLQTGQNSHCTVLPPGAALCLSLPPTEDPLIVHSGVVIALLQILPSLCDRNVQLYVAELLRSLVRTERNQQIMCQAGLAGQLLSKMKNALEDEGHQLHIVIQYMLERLAAQALEPRELRSFLRLGSPLRCDGPFKDGGAVPLTRIKTLVSMTTPKDGPTLSTVCAAFVELSLSREGFSCLFLPSVAPQSLSGPAMVGVVAADSVLGGIGAGDRVFPPQTGLTFSTWFMVERFSGSHWVRLLSIFRQLRDEQTPCLGLELSEKELRLQVNLDRATISLARAVTAGEWHHLVVCLTRSVLKNNCSPTVYFDGVALQGSCSKMSYVPQYSGAGSQNIFAIIGTTPSQRQVCALTWKQGPCHLIEEPLTESAVVHLFTLGPSYVGSLQSAPPGGIGPSQVGLGGMQVSEERITFGLNATAVSTMTLAKMRRVYSKHDCKAIAKMLGLSSHENATPIRILHNSAAHLAGAARSLGAVLIGYLGARTFVPRPVAVTMESVGGTAALLALVSYASNVESLYASLKVLVCVVRANRPAQQAMERTKGYQIVAAVLRNKSQLLNCHILHLALSLVGSAECAPTAAGRHSVAPFRDVLCNLDVWRDAAHDLQRSLYEHLLQVASDSSETVSLMRELDLVSKILYTLSEPGRMAPQTIATCCDLLRLLLQNTSRNSDILRFGQFIIWTLPARDQDPVFTNLRVKCLQLLSTMAAPSKGAVNTGLCEQLARVLGLDWFIVLLSSHLDPSTQLLALQLLSCMLCHQTLLVKFRDASCNGGWLQETDPVLLGLRVSTQSGAIKQETLHVPGFQSLEWALSKIHPNVTFSNMLLAMLFSRPVTKLPCEIVESGPINNDMFVMLCAVLRAMVASGNDAAAMAILDVISRRWNDLVSYCVNNEDSIAALASIVFPPSSSPAPPTDEVQSPATGAAKDDLTPGSVNLHSGETVGLTFALLTKLMLEGLASVQNTHILENLMNIEYLASSLQQQRQFSTLLLANTIAELSDRDLSNLSQSNVTQFVISIVDKLWQGALTAPPITIVNFISRVFLTNGGIRNYDVLRSLGRTVLFVLSRDNSANNGLPNEGLSDQLQCLHLLISNDQLLNLDPEILAALTYTLVQFAQQCPQLPMETVRRTTIHISPNDASLALASQEEANLLMAAAACKLWQIVYERNRSQLEDCCRLQLANSSGSEVPDLCQLWETNREPLHKAWISFHAAEKAGKGSGIGSADISSQIQNRVSRLTGGLSRLASRKIRKVAVVASAAHTLASSGVSAVSGAGADPVALGSMAMANAATATVTVHIAIVHDLVDLRLKQLYANCKHLHQHVMQEWMRMEEGLSAERGLWGPREPCSLDKWMLDATESGPCRMRKRTLKNKLFYQHYPYIEQQPNQQLKYKVATSLDSKLYYEQLGQLLSGSGPSSPDLVGRQQSLASTSSVYEGLVSSSSAINNNNQTSGTVNRGAITNKHQSSESDEEEPEGGQVGGQVGEGEGANHSPHSQSVERLLEEGDKITHMFRCARVQGLDTWEGLLLFGREHFYVVDGFTLLKTREIRDIDSLPEGLHEPIIPNCTPVTSASRATVAQGRTCSKFGYDDVREVHKRRYLLQPTALEVFSADGRNYLLVFPRKLRNKVYARFLALATGITDSAQESLAGQRRSANVESGAGILSSLIGETSVTQRWLRGEISNFQYLMHLNTLAGRSYNDLMQYPIFPWIVADYNSETLDLTDPKSFRDLSKPMGAQTRDRLEQFCRRFKEWDDPETPPYHYGTFYSSAMIVASYLVRMEPFTQHFLRLQGGHFDLADRMFHSIKDAFTSASRHNMADVKELIPEFFYLDEFLVNKNRFDLGAKQSGVQLDNVVLPAWAKGDPREFIRLHRAALESDYVSAHLHEWIDLIFGFRQQGPAAIEAVNVFHHLFYEGNVDIYSIDDPLKKNATIGFINNFGQIPKQLFKKPHPAKKVDSGLVRPLFYHKIESLRPSMHPVKELKGPVGQIVQQDRSVLAVEQNKMLLPPNQRFVSWGFADYSLRVCSYETGRCLLVWEQVPSGEVLCATCPDAKTIITAGTACVLSVWTVTPKRLELRDQLAGHTEPVTCIASSRPFNLIVSGSRDESCILWDLSRLTFVRQIPTEFGAPVASVCINDVTGDIAACAATRLYIYNVNGVPIAHVDTAASLTAGQARGQQILCVSFSQLNEWDKDNVIMTGSSDGVLRMWSLAVDQEGTSIVLRGKLTMHTAFERPDNKEPAAVTAVGISRDHRHVYVGDARGRVFQWSVSSETGARSDHWVRDDTAEQCSNPLCQVKFSLTERRHHCRNCGQLFCAKCSRYEAQISRIDAEKSVRVCHACFLSLSTASS
ncbi:WD repeat and FYVE domain-containing protein 3-like isoform X2 [Varroa destructor]|uniref:WD repeat and FYVE domain-containing protein 3 n=1 Tax=Varroa destructor TaxID=109461 RepID=A0A7M7IZP6_VARDE|nr:WD repeat and FYVE domain-containing protein 3-like isoform X2 [Varroa destructor]